ncbi:MAG TPA: IS4 family transposase [Nonomuraea sp.]|nr:IS4 family transposase [Nonomuraea sp.]
MLEFASPALMSSPSDLLAPGAPPEEFRERGLPLRLGVLTEQISPELVDQAVADAGRVQRRCRLLPARAVVYFVLALCLFSGADSSRPPGYRSVLRSLTTGLRQLRGIRLPTSAALTQARRRLGEAPLQLLLARLVGPLATPSTPGAFAFGRRVVAWDGSGIDVADTDDNVAAFGRASGTGYPQLRLLWLIECGTHALVDAVFDGYTVSEQKLAKRLVGALRPGMLLLADRNFPGHQLWGLAADTGADLAWRIKNHQVFWPGQPLPDGSFLSVMPTPAENVRYGQARAIGRQMPNPPQGHPVRIINYTVTISTAGGATRTEAFRLVTTLLDHQLAPAAQLAALYSQRWEIELAYGDLKTRLRGAGFILRSRSPELVRQEVFALLAVYQALCALRTRAATTGEVDPDRISVTVTIRLARDQACTQAAMTAAGLTQACQQTIADLLDELLPDRRPRSYERLKRTPRNNHPIRRHDHHRPPSNIRCSLAIADDRPYQGKHA